MWKVVAGEGVDERAVDALGLEDLQHLTQIGRLRLFVADVLAREPRGAGAVPLDHRAFDQRVAAAVRRAAMRRASELPDRDGLALPPPRRAERPDGLAA